MKENNQSKTQAVDLTCVSTNSLLNELAKREDFVEIELGRPYCGYDLIHLYYDDPKRHIAADRALLLNPRYRSGCSHHKAPTFP